jgi:hypothetical protein
VAGIAIIALAALMALTLILSFDTLNNRHQSQMLHLTDRRLAIATREGVMIGSPTFYFAGPTQIAIRGMISSFSKEDEPEL